MADPIPVPVGILRLPRGPDSSGSRGFSRDDPRADPRANPRDPDHPRDNSRANPRDPDHPRAHRRDPSALQSARAALRARFLRLLSGARGRPGRFSLWHGTRLEADFGAADVQSGTLQVDSLRTPLGTQASALLRPGDVLEFSFPLD